MEQTILNTRYRVEQKIGEGGMATVYQGQDLRLNRRVAIKVLLNQYSHDNDFVERFKHEALAAATINHPNVVNVYDVGEENNTHYIVMQYVEGDNLKTRINREAPLNVAQAVSIAEAVALGLDAAHRVGMVHRDIKPQNILIEPDGHVRITDFGIAKSHLSTAKTQTGITFGTADYISPEQAQGLTATPQSDIYALGITLYEMMTGQLPFKGDSPITVAMQHVSTPPPPPRQTNPQIPPGLEALILGAIEKDPSKRPGSAQDFAKLLRNYRSHAEQHTVATPMAAQQQPSPPPPRSSSSRPMPSQSGSTGSASTTGRHTIPSPRPAVSRAPQQQGMNCGIFVVGMVILAGVIALVLLFSTGAMDSMFAGMGSGSSNPQTEGTETPTPTPTVTPTPLPDATSVPHVAVPDITGMSESDALQALQSAGLRGVRSDSRNHDTIPTGAVFDQQVPPSIEVPIDSPVTYTLSLGPEIRLIETPNLTSRSLESARREAESLGLAVEVSEEPSTTISEGFVIRQQPNPGLMLEEGETVRLTVSMGDRVQMPDLIGMTEEAAKSVLASTDGLSFSYADYQGVDKLGNLYFEVEPGVVVSTVPDKNVWVERGTDVTLGVREDDDNDEPATPALPTLQIPPPPNGLPTPPPPPFP